MPKVIQECPKCKRTNVSEKSHSIIGSKRFITLTCGHIYTEQLSLTKPEIEKLTFADGKETYPYQMEGIKFAERSGFKCLIGDAPGLGKTIQAEGILKLHWEELKPVVIVVKASLTVQWQKYLMLQLEKFAQIVTTKDEFIKGFNIFIVSYDSVPKLEDKIKALKPKTIILDECQMIKNNDAKRTNAIRAIINHRIDRNPEETKKRTEVKSEKVKRIEVIASDLMKFHGVDENFKFSISETLPERFIGLTKCKTTKISISQAIITGEIHIAKPHVENAKDEEIIETILHEIAHAITPGAGHTPIWKSTAIAIGSTGNEFYYGCQGTIDPSKIIDDGKERMVKHQIFLSGTPIKNNAIEYWPALNMLRPEMFSSRANWLNYDVGYWLTSKGTWKPGGIKHPEAFKEKTKDFIIRRERAEVFPELPNVTRDFRYHEIGTDEMDAYNLGVKKLSDFLKHANRKSSDFSSQLQGHIMILWHITGLAKVNPIMEFVDEFKEDNEASDNLNWKLPIFHHHINVGDTIEHHLKTKGIKYERIVAANDAQTRMNKLEKLRAGECNMLIAPTLAAAEGYDLDFCDTGVILEREWNPANEEQVEGRFIRATSEMLERARAGECKVNMLYPVAVGTVDEIFAELVERKRQYVMSSLNGTSNVTNWNETEIMMELATIAVERLKAA